MKLSIIVPWYKSKETVDMLYNAVNAIFCKKTPFDSMEFIFIEDAGFDGSWEVIADLASRDSRVKAIQFSRNFGQHRAIKAGLDICTGDWAVVMDCDLQDRPEEIPRLFKKAMEGYDVVFAKRGRRKDPYWKVLTSRFFADVLNWLSGMKHNSEISNFSILSRKAVEALRSMNENAPLYGMHLQWLGFNTAYIDVEHSARQEGKSSYTLRKLINLAVDTIIAYSDRPLRFSIKAGFLMAFFSFCFAAYLSYRQLVLNIPVEGWTSIMVSMWFLGGLIIANLGIIGIYLGKVFDETKKRPLYVISKRINI